MAELHFNRGRDFECSVDIFEFIYSDWEAADRVTGRRWKVQKVKDGFKGGWSGFWADFQLIDHKYWTASTEGMFTYKMTLGGWLISGDGMLTITYSEQGDKRVKGNGTVDLKLRGLMAPFCCFFKGKLHDLVDKLTDYQHEACTAIASNPEEVMGLLSGEQQKKLKKCLNKVRDIYEASLEIEPINGKYSLKLITPLKPEEPVGGKFQDRGKAKDLLNEFNRLIEAANQRCSDANSRSVGPTDISVAGAGQNFLRELMLLGNSLYKTYISDHAGTWLESSFTALEFVSRKRPCIRVRIKAQESYSLIPWELMHDGDDFLCIKTATFRGGSKRSKTPQGESEIRGVLIVVSNPRKDLQSAHTEGENIFHSIRNMYDDIDVKLLEGKDATRENVISAIGSGRYQIIHYSGHSKFDETAPGNSYLLMNEDKHILADELARISKKIDLRMVFLNSCSSGAEKMDIFKVRGLASAFINTGVPYVLGMNWEVTDKGASLLAEKFYEEYILTNDPIESLRRAREHVGEATQWEDPAWSSPVIYAA